VALQAMKTLYVMCGLAFAGKTTVARALAKRLGAVVVSLDEINLERGLRGGEGLPVEEWERTHRIALARAHELMRAGKDVVIDDTGCFRWLRDRYRGAASLHRFDTTVVFVDTPVDQARRRLETNDPAAGRPGVRVEVLKSLAATFEPPGADEKVIRFEPGDDLATCLAVHFPVPG
jgi:predicted kinase